MLITSIILFLENWLKWKLYSHKINNRRRYLRIIGTQFKYHFIGDVPSPITYNGFILSPTGSIAHQRVGDEINLECLISWSSYSS
jgi:hypothetical protein